MPDTIQIQAFPTRDASVCEFRVSKPLLPIGELVCRSAQEAKNSTLLEALFALSGVTEVAIRGATLTIRKEGDSSWKMFATQVGAVLRSEIHEISSHPLSLPKVPASAKKSVVHEAIERILNDEINPGLASHGGSTRLVDYNDGLATIEFRGGCQGCGLSQATFKQGIESRLIAAIPEVKKVIDATDHALGTNPYFRNHSNE